MTDVTEVLRALSDGRFHSGEDLAALFGCSRSTVWKHVRRLRENVAIDAVTGRGYRLAEPLELLDREVILDCLDERHRACLGDCHVMGIVSSTNELAMQASGQARRKPRIWFAESQTGGRGRRGRSWHSPYGRNLYFSLLYRFDAPMHQLAGLSIAAGVELVTLLSTLGLQGHGLKWPNDLLWQGRKLAGILVEVSGESEGPAHAVIGIGLNIDLGEIPAWLDQPVSCLKEAGLDVSRNRVAGQLAAGMLDMCARFAEQGLQPFVDRWDGYDLYRGKRVRLSGPGLQHDGIGAGLSPDGGVVLTIDGKRRVFHGGELSLRTGERHG